MGLPGFQLIEQRIEILAQLVQLVQLGDIGRRHPLLEGPLAADVVSHLGQGLEGCRDGALHPARHMECPENTDEQAHQGSQQGLQ